MKKVFESEYWLSERKKDPNTCDESTFRTIPLGKDVKAVVCKDVRCVRERGKDNCPEQVQFLHHSKRSFVKNAAGSIIPRKLYVGGKSCGKEENNEGLCKRVQHH